MKLFRIPIVVSLISLCFPGLVSAANLQDLLSAADLAIIGTVSPQASAAGTVIILNVTPERILKGAETGRTTLSVQWAAQSDSVGGANQQPSVFTLPAAWRGIWFLKRSAGGILNPIPVRLGSKASLVDLFYQLSPSPLPESLTALVPRPESMIDELALQLANAAAAEGSADFPGNLIAATYGLDSPAIRGSFTWLVKQPQSRAKATGIAGLLARSDVAGLLACEQSASAIDTTDFEIALNELRVSFRSSDAVSLACLTRLAAGLEGYQGTLGDAAVHALVAIHTVQTLPVLAAALDSPRPERRRHAVVGLASFANGLPIQSPANVANLGFMRASGFAPFRTQETLGHMTIPPDADEGTEADYLRFWRSWWLEVKAQLGF